MSAQHTQEFTRKASTRNTLRLTPAMRRELRSIVTYGVPGDLADYGANALAFYAREKTITALIARGLIADCETATDAGRAFIKKAEATA